jgi:hypothetical protein
VNLKHVAVGVVLTTLGILIFIPAPGEESVLGIGDRNSNHGGRGGGGSGGLSHTRDQSHLECKKGFPRVPCIIAYDNGTYVYVASYNNQPIASKTKYYSCKLASGKDNDKYPCIWDRRRSVGGSNEPERFIVYWSK